MCVCGRGGGEGRGSVDENCYESLPLRVDPFQGK